MVLEKPATPLQNGIFRGIVLFGPRPTCAVPEPVETHQADMGGNQL
jgi:hypothetical protein